MDQIEKALKKLTPKERTHLQELLELIQAGKLESLDIKKLVGNEDIYRVRKGDLRVIFRKLGDTIRLMTLERRTTTTYRKR